MATIVGSLFDAESELSAADQFKAVSHIGAAVEFENASGPASPLTGTNKNDVFYVSTSSAVIGGSKAGTDIVVASDDFTLPGGVEHMLLAGTSNIDGVGNNADNVIAGNDGSNYLDGGNGSDALIGGAGRDTLIGGNGHDFLCGGDDSDVIEGGNGHDSIIGGTGRDTIIGGNGNDTIDGGIDSDSIEGGAGHDFITGGTGRDVIYGGDGSDTIKGGEDSDTLSGGRGADYFYFDANNGKDVVLDFKSGVDYVVFVSEPGGSIQPGADILGDFVHTNLDGDVVITQSSGNSITLKDVGIDDIDNSDFIIL